MRGVCGTEQGAAQGGEEYQYPNGARTHAVRKWTVALQPKGGPPKLLDLYGVEGRCPLLLGVQALEGYGPVVDFRRNVLGFQDGSEMALDRDGGLRRLRMDFRR
jgi:hypothetical protein